MTGSKKRSFKRMVRWWLIAFATCAPFCNAQSNAQSNAQIRMQVTQVTEALRTRALDLRNERLAARRQASDYPAKHTKFTGDANNRKLMAQFDALRKTVANKLGLPAPANDVASDNEDLILRETFELQQAAEKLPQ